MNYTLEQFMEFVEANPQHRYSDGDRLGTTLPSKYYTRAFESWLKTTDSQLESWDNAVNLIKFATQYKNSDSVSGYYWEGVDGVLEYQKILDGKTIWNLEEMLADYNEGVDSSKLKDLSLLYFPRKIDLEKIDFQRVINYFRLKAGMDTENSESELQNWLEAERRKPKIKIPKVEKGFIYLIENNGYYKIGKTSKPKERIKSYFETENPNEYKVIAIKEKENYHLAEKQLHEIFEHKRHRNEWFKLTKIELDYLKKLLN